MGSVSHKSDFTRIDKEDFSASFPIPVAYSFAGDKPHTGRNTGIEEKLLGKTHDTIHKVVFDQLLADIRK